MISAEQAKLLEPYFAESETSETTTRQTEKVSVETGICLRKVEWFAIRKGFVPRRYRCNLGTFSCAGQMKLLESKVVLIGLGGLGGHLLEQLGRAGAGEIVGVDPDIFDETNLNRQLLSNERNLGKEKTHQAKERLENINKAVEFTGFSCRLYELPNEVWQNADLVFDCLDNIDDRLKLAHKCSEMKCPLVHGAIAGWYGEVGVVWPESGMLEKLYQGQHEGLEKELGTPAFTAAVTASLMAAKGCQILTGKYRSTQPTIHFFDLLEDDWENIQL
ncbi:MAG: HesA/MoeB/ThiF family protein [Planctomycetota bacterium]|jgi:molybdopterin/thiamine biosynthesis adenylyltransferase